MRLASLVFRSWLRLLYQGRGGAAIDMTLGDWQKRLDEHFGALRRARHASVGDKPIFALEHGLRDADLAALQAELRAHVATRAPAKEHALPWIVHAAEIAYGFTGAEYWQTFSAETPGWSERGSRRWLRDQFHWFAERHGAARPGGAWADHFKLIAWPICHAILPRDLQEDLARVLYWLRHQFTAALLSSPEVLGRLIQERSWSEKTRFQYLAQDPVLIGQIATALLLSDQIGSQALLLKPALDRIGTDLAQHQAARAWLDDARAMARTARLRGLAVGVRDDRGGLASPNRTAREHIHDLGLEPRLFLRPTTTSRDKWDVYLHVPDFSRLGTSFPAAARALSESRCRVAGEDRWRARSWLLHRPAPVRLARWPAADEALVQLERPVAELDFLLRTDCLLRPATTRLFRLQRDGLAYELRSLAVRPGEAYILVEAAEAPCSLPGSRRVDLSCAGLRATLVEIPRALTSELSDAILHAGLEHARTIAIWPAGLAASAWDGEGRAEWLTLDAPCIAVRPDHDVAALRVELDDQRAELDVSVAAGQTVFVALEPLAAGAHRLRVSATDAVRRDRSVGELDIRVRTPRPWQPGPAGVGPLVVDLEPATPSIEELWDGRARIEVRGPTGRRVTFTVRFYAEERGAPTHDVTLAPLELPISADAWRRSFEHDVRKSPAAADAYDEARLAVVTASAEELGAFVVRCERPSTPLRWALRRARDGRYRVRIIDEGSGGDVAVDRYGLETPDVPVPVSSREFDASQDGGLYVARSGSEMVSLVVAPVVRTFRDLRVEPRVADRARTPTRAAELLNLMLLWAGARLAGEVIADLTRRQILDALTAHLFYILGGEAWERAERDYLAGAPVDNLRRAVASREHAGLAIAILRDAPTLAHEATAVRARRFSDLAVRFLQLRPRRPAPVGPVVRRSSAGPDDPTWLCELALRLSSDPLSAISWAGKHRDEGVVRLAAQPVLARAARFMAFAVAGRRDAPGDVRSAWPWP